MTKIAALALAVLALPLAAQRPPVNHSHAVIGERFVQPAGSDAPGAQTLMAHCPLPAERAVMGGWRGVVYGSRITWSSSATSPAGGFYAPGMTGPAFFAVAEWDDAYGSAAQVYAAESGEGIPGSASGLGAALLHPAKTVFVMPMSHRVGAGPARDIWMVELVIPNSPALVGTKWASQSFRVDPTDGLLYLSDAVVVEVCP